MQYCNKKIHFLVSRLCQVIDEKIYVVDKKSWFIADVQEVVNMILEEKNTFY